MCRYLTNKLSNEKGYTFIDGILQLSVFIIFAQIFALIMWSLYTTEKKVADPSEIEWALFIQYVEAYLNDVENFIVQSEQPGIRFYKQGIEYDVEYSSNVVRKQIKKLGHEPLLLNVQTLNVIAEGQKITFFVTFFNGQQKDHTFYVTYST
ncbi:competence type IV pilus minor pilin ComGF [Psychrobacillus sp. FSL K6-2684]|uniref:competence type IV pilus minor pilin ComGF n=1 Tax=Psychrobacillus sp. FSL K6-2684 TaxID=2921547 RepID=UPI0030F66B7A